MGKAKMIRDGKDVLFISTGLMTMRALEAARSGISTAAVVASVKAWL